MVETKSEVLAPPVVSGDPITFAVGSFIIIKLVGKVQLLIPAYGYCPEPCECEEYSTQDVCNMFDYADFPEFFPPQLSQTVPVNTD